MDADFDPTLIAAWQHARIAIPCASRHRQCPASSEEGMYSFTYVREGLGVVHYDVPKAASSYICKEFVDGSNAYSLCNPSLPLSSYFTFALVRNPWDRMASNFFIFCRSPHRLLRKRQFESLYPDPVPDFARFVEIAARHPNHHWQPQSLYVPESVDYVGKPRNSAKPLR